MPQDQQGVAISTFGKVIKRGWDWLGISPPAPERTAGLIEMPALAESLTLNKGDFIRSGVRGALYLMCRKALQETVVAQLEVWGQDTTAHDDAARRKAARPFERDLASVLEDLSGDYPALASLVEHRPAAGGRRLQTMGLKEAHRGLVFDDVMERGESEPASLGPPQEGPPVGSQPVVGPQGDGDGGEECGSPLPAEPNSQEDVVQKTPALIRKPGRYGLTLAFESRPDDSALGRLVENTVTVNIGHPAYQRAERTRAEGYHLALVAAMSLAKIAVESPQYDGFVTDFLSRWGSAMDGRRKGRR